MTWHTQSGDRYLTGAEARLFRAGLCSLAEAIEDGRYDFEHTVLVGQSSEALLQLLAFVGTHLLLPTDPMPELNAWTEGAVANVFVAVRSELEYEARRYPKGKSEKTRRWRNMIEAAYSEICAADTDDGIEETDSADPGKPVDHDDLIEIIQDCILWDDDWSISTDVDRALADSQLEYFDWRTKSAMTTEDAIKTLGDLCGFRRGDFDGIEVE